MHLGIQLENNKHYHSGGNIFSKFLLFSEQKNSVVVTKANRISGYQEIGKMLHISIVIIDNYTQLLQQRSSENTVFLISTENAYYHYIDSYHLKKESIDLKVWDIIEIDVVIQKLVEMWFHYAPYPEARSYERKWDTLIIYLESENEVVHIGFWGNSIEDIRHYRQGSIGSIQLGSTKNFEETGGSRVLHYLQEQGIHILLDELDTDGIYHDILDISSGETSIDLLSRSGSIWLKIEPPKIDNIDELTHILQDKEKETYIFTKNVKIIENYRDYNRLSGVKILQSRSSYTKSFETSSLRVICDDILNTIFVRKRIKKSMSGSIDLLLNIQDGDYVVHIDHGIGVFLGITKKKISWIEKEYVEISYLNNEKLFVPITEVGRVSKYIGVEKPKLTGLSTKVWEKKMQLANEEAQKIADELLQIYIQRTQYTGYAYHISPTAYTVFKQSFEHSYTEDQETCIHDIHEKMSLPTPMDYLLIGDVGFWKTEVAFQAIYQAILNKKQVAFICPLVVLAYEHYEKAEERFRNFWIRISVLTRLETIKQTSQTLKRLKRGEVDLIIGTHKLLGEDVKYQNLGLLILDEEHKFWVQDKEKLKKLKSNIDVLSMSATPIPRSLNMALSNIRDIGIISTPPVWRQSIHTIVTQTNEQVIYTACNEEFKREGQVFFIHNSIRSIEHQQKTLQSLFPTKKIVITHGQLRGYEIEDRIIDFKHKKYDILLSTTVIENGIDFANVNTIIIDKANHFWISQIHQLRGRVGRSSTQWYCYLLYTHDDISEEAAKKLTTIVEHSYLGSGYELAMKDLEIRWWWDILGVRQSGQKTEIGIHLFLKMVEEKVEEGQQQNTGKKRFPRAHIDIDLPIHLEDEYFNSELDKINFYRELESIETKEELEEIQKDFSRTRYIERSDGLHNLFKILELQIIAGREKVTHIKKIGRNYQIDFSSDITLEEVKHFLSKDTNIYWSVVTISRLRSETHRYRDDTEFIDIILSTLQGQQAAKKKVRLKKS